MNKRKILEYLVFTFLVISVFCFAFILVGGNAILAEDEAEFDAKISEIAEKYEEIKSSEDFEEELQLMENVKAKAQNLQQEYPHRSRANWEAAKAYSNYNYFANLEEDETINVLEKGKEYAERAIEEDPENARAHFWLGSIIGELGQEQGIMGSLASVDPMQEALEKAIELDPDFAPAYDVLARLYRQAPGWPLSIGDDEEALKYSKKSVEVAPNNSTYLWRLYEIYRELDREEKAEEVLEEILDLPETNDFVREDVGEIKEKAEAELEDL